MKQTVLDVLIFLFEHYMDDDNAITVDEDALRLELIESGFAEQQIGKAFEWLQGLAEQQQGQIYNEIKNSNAIRVFTQQEQQKLGLDSRGLLFFLEQIGVLGHHSRELVLDRVMALEQSSIEIDQLKWVILMVLFNQPGDEEPLGWMEDLVMDNHDNDVLH